VIAPLLLAGVLVAQTASAQSPGQAVQAEAPALTDLERLRVENHALKLRLAQLETQLRTRDLTEERAALDAALRAAYPGWGMDWQTGVLSLLPPATETTP
jgi:hypothetical protein